MRLYCGNSPRRRIVAYNLINMPGRVYTTGSTNIIHFRLCLRSSLVSTRQECCNEGGAFPDGISRLEGRLEAEDLQRYLLPESTTAIVQLLMAPSYSFLPNTNREAEDQERKFDLPCRRQIARSLAQMPSYSQYTANSIFHSQLTGGFSLRLGA